MRTIKQCSDPRFSGSGFTIREAYEAPESEIIQIKMDSSILQASGGGSGEDWNQGGGD
ncbi:MAG: hypothetical protein IK103_05585 [Bacteroidales bacterium]|nr:hypothetical protein [Bacteroidales bacterium]